MEQITELMKLIGPQLLWLMLIVWALVQLVSMAMTSFNKPVLAVIMATLVTIFAALLGYIQPEAAALTAIETAVGSQLLHDKILKLFGA